MSEIIIPTNAPIASARRLRSVLSHYEENAIIWPTSPLEVHAEPEVEHMLFFRHEYRFGSPKHHRQYGRLVVEAHREPSPNGMIAIRAWHVYRDQDVELKLMVATWQDAHLVRLILELRADITEWIARGAFERRS